MDSLKKHFPIGSRVRLTDRGKDDWSRVDDEYPNMRPIHLPPEGGIVVGVSEYFVRVGGVLGLDGIDYFPFNDEEIEVIE